MALKGTGYEAFSHALFPDENIPKSHLLRGKIPSLVVKLRTLAHLLEDDNDAL